MIYIIPNGRFGNILFSIGICIILSEKYPNQTIYLDNKAIIEYYNNINIVTNLFPILTKYLKSIDTISAKKLCNKIYECHDHIYLENIIDSDNIFFCGYFQRSEYYIIYRNIIKNNMNNIFNTHFLDEIVVHLRSGDCWTKDAFSWGHINLKGFAWQPIPPITYYTNILDNETNIKFVVERTDDPILIKLLDIYKKSGKKIIIQSKDFYSDFITLLSSKKLVLSVSSFSYWGAFLSNAEIIHIPQGGFFNKNCLRKDINWQLDISGVINYELSNEIYNGKWIGNKNNLNYVLNN